MTDALPNVQRPTILVVDDTPQNLSLMSGLLEEHYTAKLAPSGARALKIAASHPPDLILLDIMMPEMDCYEVCTALKANPATAGIPVIFLTAMDTMEDEEKGLLAGAVDYITKPISPPILMARVRNQLALKNAIDQLREQNKVVEQERLRARELLHRLKEASDKMIEQNRLLKVEKQRAFDFLFTLGSNSLAQGNLDVAWDTLRQCPSSDEVMAKLYTLALELEAAGQARKVLAVVQHMAQSNPEFRDIPDRLARLAADEAAASGTGSLSASATRSLGGIASLGRYRIDRELGHGAMGIVYQGTDPSIGRVVAIKTMELHLATGAEDAQGVKERFFREAESAGRLAHSDIVAIYDVGEQGTLAYIAMEFLKGTDLASYVAPEKRLPIDKVLGIVARVAEALHFAHSQGVIHRDIKPSNIIYEAQTDSVKVTDFGIASLVSSTQSDSGLILGTPSYMSPEQTAGKGLAGRSDIYSLGVTLYQLASGWLPFQADSLAQLLFKIANEPPVDIRTIEPDFPACVAGIIEKALAKNPDERFATGEQMARSVNLCRRSMTVFAPGGGQRS